MREIAASLALIDEAVRRYSPVAVLGLFSGGDDSLTACHIAAQHRSFTAACHINTGIGVPATREFVRSTAAERGWNLREYRAEDCGQRYRDLVIERGFPGPAHHYKMYNRLKERPLRRAVKEAKRWRARRAKVVLISGCRSQESTRRMGHVEPIQVEGSLVWVAPIHDWSKLDCLEYLAANDVERNPVAQLIHKSGECLCGAFAKPGELEELSIWYPEVAAEIRALEVEARAAGHNWGWGQRPPKKGKIMPAGPLCHSCDKEVAA